MFCTESQQKRYTIQLFRYQTLEKCKVHFTTMNISYIYSITPCQAGYTCCRLSTHFRQ